MAEFKKYIDTNQVFSHGQEVFIGITIAWNSITQKWEQKSRFVQLRGVPQYTAKPKIDNSKKEKIDEQKEVYDSFKSTELEEFEL
jgi:hypothetical protein